MTGSHNRFIYLALPTDAYSCTVALGWWWIDTGELLRLDRAGMGIEMSHQKGLTAGCVDALFTSK